MVARRDILSVESVFSRQSRKSRLMFGLADVAFIAAAFAGAYWIRQNLELTHEFYLLQPIIILLFLVSSFAWILAGRWLSVYDHLEAVRTAEVVVRTLRQTAVAATAIILFAYITRLELSRLFLGLFVVFSVVSILTLRLAARYLSPALRQLSSETHILVVGSGEPARRIARLIEQNYSYGLRLLGFLDGEPGTVQLERLHTVQPIQALSSLLSQHVVDEIVFAVDSQQLSRMEDVLLLCEEEGVRTRLAIDFFPHLNANVYLDRLGPAPLLTFSSAPADELRLLVKRVVDTVLAFTGLIVAAPFMLLIAWVIRLSSPGPVFFGQTRCGLNGRTFTMYKFRTMYDGAEARRAEVAHLNVKTTAFKVPNDPRVTPVGRWLRKFSIDELPQLWNIVRGEMALVGPRPAVPSEVEQYKRWQRRRLRMRPGLTCLWALAGRDTLDFEEWMRLDLAYIDQWSIGLDWSILLRSIPYVLMGKGAN